MSRRPLLFRVLVTLVAAWYGLIAGGQLSLVEGVATSARLATQSQPAQPMPHGSMVMAGMDCHRSSIPNGQKQLCLCIDTGCFQLSVALPSVPTSWQCDAGTPIRFIRSHPQLVVALADDYLLPPATAPPQA